MRSGHVFEKFATAEKQGGRPRRVLREAHRQNPGGTIGFESSEETGTTKGVTLPLAWIAPSAGKSRRPRPASRLG